MKRETIGNVKQDNTSAHSCTHCCSGNTTMCSLCTVELHVTVN